MLFYNVLNHSLSFANSIHNEYFVGVLKLCFRYKYLTLKYYNNSNIIDTIRMICMRFTPPK